jgi:tRNA(Leu) C34 or U34 (ribose-2'-O)-methylase TrmL
MILPFLSPSFQIVIFCPKIGEKSFFMPRKNSLITEGLDLTEPMGFDLFLNNDVLRLTLHIIKKIEDEKIDEIFNKLKAELNKIGD